MEVSPYICVMDNKQMTKIIKKGLGKKTFPFEYGNMKGTFRFVSVKELSYDYGEGYNWGVINVEVDIIQDSKMCINYKEWGRSQNLITRRRNNDIFWVYKENLLHTMLKFYSIHSSKVGKITYKKKPNVLKNKNLGSILETSKESSSLLCQVVS
jgi:hypothetical protein